MAWSCLASSSWDAKHSGKKESQILWVQFAAQIQADDDSLIFTAISCHFFQASHVTSSSGIAVQGATGQGGEGGCGGSSSLSRPRASQPLPPLCTACDP